MLDLFETKRRLVLYLYSSGLQLIVFCIFGCQVEQISDFFAIKYIFIQSN